MSGENWQDLPLDPRVLQAIVRLKWTNPTPVQKAAIPFALEGKDILAKAKTGSGKTGAYAIPIVQRALTLKETDRRPHVFALILVPTAELALQVRNVVQGLLHYCSKTLTVLSLSSDQTVAAQIPRLEEIPDILIATPGRLLVHLEKKKVFVDSTSMVVVDEADVMTTYGFKDDIEKVKRFLPKIAQGFLMSATLNDDVSQLKNLILHTPVVLELEDNATEGQLSQFSVQCTEDDKFLLLYVMVKLKLITGKTLIFVNDISRCFKVKLFLERFSIRCGVLNSELPQASRHHIVDELNRGVINLVVATDENQFEEDNTKTIAPSKPTKQIKVNVEQEEEDSDEFNLDLEPKPQNNKHNDNNDNNDDNDNNNDNDDSDSSDDNIDTEEKEEKEENDEESNSSSSDDNEDIDDMEEEEEENEEEEKEEGKKKKEVVPSRNKNKRRKKGKRNKTEYGVERGVDFQKISNIINFDLPIVPVNYVHRIGRTARAGKHGLAIAFVTKNDEKMLETLKEQQKAEGNVIAPYVFKSSVVEGFRYRVEGVLRTVNMRAVKSARLQEIKREMLNSDTLKSHFAANPVDLNVLEHDAALQSSKVKKHLAFVPDYLMPSKKELQQICTPEGDTTLPPTEEEDERNWGVAYSTRIGKQRNDVLFGTRRGPIKRRRSMSTIPDHSGKKRRTTKKKERRRDKADTKIFKSKAPKRY